MEQYLLVLQRRKLVKHIANTPKIHIHHHYTIVWCKLSIFFLLHQSQLFRSTCLVCCEVVNMSACCEHASKYVWSYLCSVVSFVMCVCVYIYKYIPVFSHFRFELMWLVKILSWSLLLQCAEKLSSSCCVELGMEPFKCRASKPACDPKAVLQFLKSVCFK